MRLLCSNCNITVQWTKDVQILLYIAKIISLYASSRPNLNFDGYLTFESTFKVLKSAILFLFQLMQVLIGELLSYTIYCFQVASAFERDNCNPLYFFK